MFNDFSQRCLSTRTLVLWLDTNEPRVLSDEVADVYDNTQHISRKTYIRTYMYTSIRLTDAYVFDGSFRGPLQSVPPVIDRPNNAQYIVHVRRDRGRGDLGRSAYTG